MTDLIALKAANAKRWANAKLNRSFASVTAHLVAPVAKARYQAVQAKTGVPWFVIAVIHERESSQDWTGSLAQGDPWNRVSVHVPAGRGPFKSWEEAAADALVNCPPYAARNKDWSIGGLLTMLEQYNGVGYANKGRPSPYIWSGTDQYVSGKYVRDCVYDPGAVDKQLGCGGLLISMAAIDRTISFDGKRTPTVILPTTSETALDFESGEGLDRRVHREHLRCNFQKEMIVIISWDKAKAFFKDSLTILWARIQYVGGILAAGLIVAFSGYDFTQLTSMDAKAAFKMLMAVAIAGVLTEIARRRTV
jgi:lysozyme family protein